MSVVLIVEDEESYRDALGFMLEREGFEVLLAADGAEGLAQFDRHGADIVLLDLMMPGLSGTEVCRRLRQRSTVPIIMVTAHGRAELFKEANEQRINAILAKPVTTSDLFDTLVQIQNGKRVRAPLLGEVFDATRVTLSGIRGARILLVEDNELNQQVAQEFLSKGGLAVTVAGNGQEALNLLQHNRFDAILMDLHMPVMDGFETTRRLRARPEYAELPIIAMTAAAMAKDREASAAAAVRLIRSVSSQLSSHWMSDSVFSPSLFQAPFASATPSPFVSALPCVTVALKIWIPLKVVSL